MMYRRFKYLSKAKDIEVGKEYLFTQPVVKTEGASLIGTRVVSEFGGMTVMSTYRAKIVKKYERFMLVDIIPVWSSLDSLTSKPYESYRQTVNYADMSREAYFFEMPDDIDYLTIEEVREGINETFKILPVRRYVG